jgi:hypothetical protein
MSISARPFLRSHGVRWSAVVAVLALSTPAVSAQSCLGYPAFPTARLNVSLDAIVGSDYGGGGLNANYGSRSGGPFAGAEFAMIKYVVDPRETRTNFGGMVGWERYTKDQLIFCPFISANFENGNEYDIGNGPESVSGNILGAGLGIGFELNRSRGRLSYNPHLSARLARVASTFHTEIGDEKVVETGAIFGFGVGIRIRDAIQITPGFSGATFEQANLVFDLRISVALQLRKQ